MSNEDNLVKYEFTILWDTETKHMSLFNIDEFRDLCASRGEIIPFTPHITILGNTETSEIRIQAGQEDVEH